MQNQESSDKKTLEQYLLMLILFIQDSEKLYNEFSKDTSNHVESKKLKLTYEKYFNSYMVVHATCYQIFNDFCTVRDTVFKQGEMLVNIRPEVEALKQPKLIKTLDELSTNGLTIVTPLLKKQFDYFFALIKPCIAANISSLSRGAYITSLINATESAEDSIKGIEKNIVYLGQSAEKYYNFSLIFKTYIDKVSKLIEKQKS